MSKAARAIIIENDKLLVMARKKLGSQYFTLVGGKVADDESIEQALLREIKEETGLDITTARLVFTEAHAEPYNQQYIYLCSIGPHSNIGLSEYSEEYELNKLGSNTHEPLWANSSSFEALPFRTPNLQAAIVYSLRKGFPPQPVDITDDTFYVKEMKRQHRGVLGLSRKLKQKLRRK